MGGGEYKLSPRERVLRALTRKTPDKIPRTLSFTPPLQKIFEEKTGVNDPDEYFDLEVRYVGIKQTRQKTDFSRYHSETGHGIEVNEWGVGLRAGSCPGSHLRDYLHPMGNFIGPEEVKNYPFPDVDVSYRFVGLGEDVKKLQERGYAVVASLPIIHSGLFECAWLLRGLENLLIDFTENKKMAELILDKVTELAIKGAKELVRAGIDILITGDDVGTQRGMMMSRKTWQEWIKPRQAQIIREVKKINPNLIYFYHSDGSIEEIIPELIEIGIDVLNPVQPECMDPVKVKREYGNFLSFWGTIGTQTTMPMASPEGVKKEVKRMIETVGKGGGLLIAPTHVLEDDVPWANVLAFLEAVEKYGRY